MHPYFSNFLDPFPPLKNERSRHHRLAAAFPIRLGLLLWTGLLGTAISSPAKEIVFHNQKSLERDLKSVAKDHSNLIRIQVLAESLDGRKIWVAEAGHGKDEDRRTRPAMLVVAGIEGNDLTGPAVVSHWLESLAEGYATNETIKQLLDTTTVYAVPRLNPDAAVAYFEKPRREPSVNGRPVDDDHDGLRDEDGPEDLNKDGFITWMRVQDPDGDAILDPAEPRLLLAADRAKGEVGAWKLLSEGLDNDHDESWNEDGPGGVNFNRNFPYNYKFFGATSGLHQMSEPETRALADFIVDHPNIGIVFVFGEADNLLQTPKGEDAIKRPPTVLQNKDVPYYRELGQAWREALGLKKELSGNQEPGSFSDWIYYHRGRLGLAARPWSPAIALQREKDKEEKAAEKKETQDAGESKADKESEKAKGKEEPDKAKPAEASQAKDEAKDAQVSAKEGAKPEEKKKPAEDKRNEEERNFLHWLDKNAPEAFLAWQPFEHPDFPGQKVEIGGYAPYAKSNPPASLLPELADREAAFLTKLLGKLPRLAIRKTALKDLGEGVYDLTVTVENRGYLPSSLAQGETTREVFPTRVTLQLENDAVLSGTRRVMRNAIPGSGGAEEFRWVFFAKEKAEVEIEIVSMLGGTLRQSIILKP